ncbi:Hypp1716 [Branchiostoma lanceolatum]|uniref:Hypp1716 protein n=1 Tax=Branchiostoma lanceolatum TaxID=7740 RepID=A0A8J9ZJU4_BRALA|nr:Hypp1716 [Branchiostoma lanceolatum]
MCLEIGLEDTKASTIASALDHYHTPNSKFFNYQCNLQLRPGRGSANKHGFVVVRDCQVMVNGAMAGIPVIVGDLVVERSGQTLALRADTINLRVEYSVTNNRFAINPPICDFYAQSSISMCLHRSVRETYI